MPLVHVTDLLGHAREAGYRATAFGLSGLDCIVPVIESAERIGAPVILSFSEELGRALPAAMAAAIAVARVSPMPVVIEARVSPIAEAIARAVRYGANSLVLLAAGTTRNLLGEAVATAHASGVPVFVACERPESVAAGVKTPDPAYRYCALRPGTTVDAARSEAERLLMEAGCAGHAERARAACRPWREVEHVIIYNANGAGPHVGEIISRGHAVLGTIPGVRRVFTGRALRDDARYRYCWLVRFAGPAVVASYRDHPDHVAFADAHFRPVAADRISIDFESVE